MADMLPSGGSDPVGFVPLRSEGSGSVELPRDIEALQDAFIRAHALERREPGGRKWPFAGDGPWHLIQRDRDEAPELEDRSETLIETDAGKLLQVRKLDSRMPRTSLDAAEVAELALLRQWLMLVPERDRKLVWIATARLHAGEGRVPWKAIGRWLKIDRSPDTLALWYRQGLARAVCSLNGWPQRRAMRMAA